MTHSRLHTLHKYALSVDKVPGSMTAAGKAQCLSLKVLNLVREMDVHKRMISGSQWKCGEWFRGSCLCLGGLEVSS